MRPFDFFFQTHSDYERDFRDGGAQKQHISCVLCA